MSLTRIDLAVRVPCRAVRFFQPYRFHAYGPHTGPFFLWFSKEIAK